MWRAVRRLGVRDADVEDLVHDVFAAAYRSWHTVDGARPVRPWLLGVCFRVVSDYLRRHSVQREESSSPESLAESQRSVGKSPQEALETQQGLTMARQLIDALELERRVVFVMHELEEVPVPEIAEALGIPLNTAYSRLRLARRDFEAAASSLTVGEGRAS